MYDTGISSYTYTGSENINAANNEISSTFPSKVNDEVVFKSKVKLIFRIKCWNIRFYFSTTHRRWFQPIAIFKSLDKSVEFAGGLDVPNFYNNIEIDAIGDELPSLVLNTYIKTGVDNSITNSSLTGSENICIASNRIS